MKLRFPSPFFLAALAVFALLARPVAGQDSGGDAPDGDAAPEAPAAGNPAPESAPESTPPPTSAPPAPVIQRENLINNSPFRIRAPQRDTTVVSQVLEIRGFMGSGRNLEVSLSNPNTFECQWVRVGDPDARWFVESADPVARTANVRMDGVVIPVSMVKPAELPPPAAPPVPTLAGAGGGSVGGGSGIVPGGGGAGVNPAGPVARPPGTFGPQRPGGMSPDGSQPGGAVSPSAPGGRPGGSGGAASPGGSMRSDGSMRSEGAAGSTGSGIPRAPRQRSIQR